MIDVEKAFQNHTHWSAVKDVCAKLSAAGYQALLAGGCVRDLLMNREPNDFDIASDATPDQVEALFPKALTVGKQFGVTILPYEGFQLEVATFREDLEYKDGRRPEGVRFSSPEADAKRRDFTINALFLELATGKIHDFVGGEADIRARVIRTVGDPDRRFGEDKLRITRAVRFASQLEFDLDPVTLAAVERLAPEAAVVSRERIRDELLKLLKPPGRLRGLELLLKTRLLEALFPSLAPHVHAVEKEWLARFGRVLKMTGELALALFFQPAFGAMPEKEFREKFLKDLRLDNKQVDDLVFALRHLETYLRPERIRRGELLLSLFHPASAITRELAVIFEGKATERAAELTRLASAAKPAPYLTGVLAQSAGVKPGPELGKVLNEAYLLQLEGKLNSSAEALAWLKGRAT